MFAPFAGDWAPDPVFHIKLTLIVLGLIFAFVVQRGVVAVDLFADDGHIEIENLFNRRTRILEDVIVEDYEPHIRTAR